jgi:hypothetical protein
MKGIVCTKERAKTSSGIIGLGPAILGKFYTMVWDGLVDIAIFCTDLELVLGF